LTERSDRKGQAGKSLFHENKTPDPSKDLIYVSTSEKLNKSRAEIAGAVVVETERSTLFSSGRDGTA
jgi:hypothetical protein